MSLRPTNPRADRRQAARVDACIPIRLCSGQNTVRAESTNLSRVGTLLRIRLDELGLHPEAPLDAVADSLRRVLGDLSRAEFRYDELGGLITRTMRMVRIHRAAPGQEWVEIGCAMRRPLSDDEVGVLRLELPRCRWPGAADEAVEETNGSEPLQMVVCPADWDRASPLTATTEELTAHRALGAMADASGLPVCGTPKGVSTVLSALTTEYGPEPKVVFMRESESLWSGQASIECVELDPVTGRIQMTVGFAQDLTVPELSMLARR